MVWSSKCWRGFWPIRLSFCLVLMLLGSTLSAQTFSEWFRQKKTQQRYLLEQIAALEVYLNAAQKGYRVVSEGWGLVRDLSTGEMGLHDAFFKGLGLVNPVVKNDARVAETLLLQVDILRALAGLKGMLSSGDLAAHVSSVAAVVVSDCLLDLSELGLVMVSGKIELRDDERLSRLEAVHVRMQERYGYVRRFCAEVHGLVRQQQVEEAAIRNLGRYYGIR